MSKIISREDAKIAGYKKFFTGVPCINGHICERYVNGNGCYECMKKRTRENRHKYYTKIQERRKIRDKKNRKKLNKRQLEYVRKNHDLVKKIRKRTYIKHKDKILSKIRECHKVTMEYLFFNDPEEYIKKMKQKSIRQQIYIGNKMKRLQEEHKNV